MTGLFGALAQGLAGKDANVLDMLPGFARWGESKTGISVDWSSALCVATVLACTDRVADGVAMPPWKVMKPLAGGGAEDDDKSPVYELLYRRPNRWQTSFEFRKTMMYHLMLCWNAFMFKSIIDREVGELIPIEPQRVTVQRNPDYSLTYKVRGDNGTTRDFPQEAIWHVRGPSWNSWMGMDPMKFSREAIGLSLATEETHALLHKNGAQLGGVYSIEGKLDTKGYKELQDWILSQVGGPNKHKPLVIDRSGKFTPNMMSGVDSQHLETRRHQIEEVCRFMNVRPIMVMHSSKEATFASSEQMFIAHVVHTLNPWWEALQQSADVNLFRRGSKNFTKFNPGVLLRGSMEAEAEYFAKALGSGGSRGWMTQNEVRALKDSNPLPDGNELPQPIVSGHGDDGNTKPKPPKDTRVS